LMLGILGLTMLAGQRVALPLFILLYLRLWGRCGWVFAIAYALIGWLFLQFMFDQVVHVMWYPSFLED